MTQPKGKAGEGMEACEHCDDSGYVEFVSGGFWTGNSLRSRLEICDCICGDDVRRERSTPPPATGERDGDD